MLTRQGGHRLLYPRPIPGRQHWPGQSLAGASKIFRVCLGSFSVKNEASFVQISWRTLTSARSTKGFASLPTVGASPATLPLLFLRVIHAFCRHFFGQVWMHPSGWAMPLPLVICSSSKSIDEKFKKSNIYEQTKWEKLTCTALNSLFP